MTCILRISIWAFILFATGCFYPQSRMVDRGSYAGFSIGMDKQQVLEKISELNDVDVKHIEYYTGAESRQAFETPGSPYPEMSFYNVDKREKLDELFNSDYWGIHRDGLFLRKQWFLFEEGKLIAIEGSNDFFR